MLNFSKIVGYPALIVFFYKEKRNARNININRIEGGIERSMYVMVVGIQGGIEGGISPRLQIGWRW